MTSRGTESEAVVARITTLTNSARATWFTYLGILLFVAVTLLSVRHLDFFDGRPGIELPIVGVTVPVTIFILASAFLVTAINGYLHVVLEEFWSVLAEAPAVMDDERPLVTMLPPWLVTGFALHVRARVREETKPPISSSPLGRLGAAVSFVLLFLAGPALLIWLWLVSQPAHEAWLTLLVGVLATVALAISITSFDTLIRRMRQAVPSRSLVFRMVVLALGGLLATVSLARTEWDPRGAQVTRNPETNSMTTRVANWFRPAAADLRSARITHMSRDWVPHEEALAAFSRDWCQDRPEPSLCREIGLSDSAFFSAYRKRRERAIAILEKPDLSHRHMDHASFVIAFMPGVSMNGAKLRRSDFQSAVLEGISAQRADFTNAVLMSADASMANFRRANLAGANMFAINAPGADFVSANLRNANLGESDLSHALLNTTELTGSRLRDALLRGTKIHRSSAARADLRNADLTGAELVQTDLSGAWLGRTRIGRATISSVNFTGANLTSLLIEHDGRFWFGKTDFTKARLHWVAFRNADMSHARFDGPETLAHTFGDGSVVLPKDFPRPCQWVDEVLNDFDFHAHWRGLTQATNLQPAWSGMPDPAYNDVTPALPPDTCDIPEIDPETNLEWERAFQTERAAR